MNETRYRQIVQEIKVDLAHGGETPSYPESWDMAAVLLDGDPELDEYLKSVCADPVGRLANDLT